MWTIHEYKGFSFKCSSDVDGDDETEWSDKTTRGLLFQGASTMEI